MNPELDIFQLVVQRTAKGPSVVAKTELPFEMEEFALRTAIDYGEPGEGSFDAVFALPLDPIHCTVATVRQDNGVLFFRFLFVHREAYRWIGDPFEISDRFPLNMQCRGSLPMLRWPDEPRPLRQVADLQHVLKDGDGPLLLGATQAILDGARLLVERAKPDRKLIRGLWQLLPDASRGEIWPAEFCLGPALLFHIACMPVVVVKAGTLNEEQAKDYPAGRYELALQLAAETGDQVALNQVLARRSSREVLRMALAMLAFAMLVVVGLKFIR